MQPNYTSFLDELEKIASDEMLAGQIGGTIGNVIGAAMNMPVKGKSVVQKSVDEKIEQARRDPSTSEGKMKRLKKAKKNAQVAAEMSYGQLAAAPAGLVGLLMAKEIGKTIKPSNVGTPEMVSALKKELHSKMKVVPVSNIRKAMYIPEGGAFPKILRPLEEFLYDMRSMPMSRVRSAIREGGAAFAPAASPEIVGHELGHAALRRGKWAGKLWTAGRMGAPLAGAIAAGAMLGAEDPKDWKVKAAPLAAAAGLAPLFAEEALASKKGLGAVKKVAPQLSTKALKGMKGALGKALGTYGAFMGAATLLPITAMAVSRTVTGKKPSKG